MFDRENRALFTFVLLTFVRILAYSRNSRILLLSPGLRVYWICKKKIDCHTSLPLTCRSWLKWSQVRGSQNTASLVGSEVTMGEESKTDPRPCHSRWGPL